MRKTLARSLILISLVFLAAFFLRGCDNPENYRASGGIMGTTYHVTMVGVSQGPKLADNIQQELRRIDALMSTYKDESEVSRFNRAPVGEWFAISPELLDIMLISRRISEWSNGAFDITVRPLVDLWGFGPVDTGDKVPRDEQIAATRAQVDYRHVEIRTDPPALKKLAPVTIDLSAVAKGYAVDKVAELLDKQGVANYLVEVGGEVRTRGLSARGDSWRIAVEEPGLLQGEVYKTLPVSDQAVATSGDYRNYFESDGRRYSHTIDPRTGYPVTHNLASVTVIAEDAASADALATAIDVLGPEEGMVLAQTRGIAVLMLIREGDGFAERFSAALVPHLEDIQKAK